MDLELCNTGIKLATICGPEGNPWTVGNRACLGDLLSLNVWAHEHCLAGVRNRSGGFDGGLSTIGLPGPWIDKGLLALGLGKVPPCWVHISVVDRMEVSDVVDKLAFGQIVWLTKWQEYWGYFINYI